MLVKDFQYPKLFRAFESISRIPRPSYHEKAIADYIVDFATKRGLECYRDEVNNVLVNIPATEGREQEAPILLQGHTDMVCEKNKGVEHDFLTDPIKLRLVDGWIRAEGTTLGADNGVAVAAMLALMDGAADSHVALQCLFTTSEEVGLDGANAFDYNRIYARKMLNMDSADESLIIAGCAGGLRSDLTFTGKRIADAVGNRYKISVGGLFGGHSGEDIHRGRANANKLIGRILYELNEANDSLLLVSIEGGSKENAIPREAEAVICYADEEMLYSVCDTVKADIKSELCPDDSNFFLKVEKIESCALPFNKDFSDKIIFIVYTAHNGVIDLKGGELAGTVEFSRNLGILDTKEDTVSFVFNSRSSMESRLDLAERQLDALAKRYSGKCDHYSRYPGWVYAEESEIRSAYKNAYRTLFGGEPEVEVIHAGLECGIIKKSIPDMDMISCGPIVVNLHSPDEALNVKSFENFFSVVLKVIE